MTGEGDATAAIGRPTMTRLAAAFAALVVLTIGELYVAGAPGDRAARITALAGLLIAKVGLVLSFFMHARASRGAAALTLVSIGFAAATAVVLMAETVFRVGAR
jgi:heme/copper-type cytochrome/quinol oxidase subunit 4